MTEQFGVGIGPFTGRINAGLLDTTGRAFKRQQDCTDQALVAAAIYTLRHDGEITVTDDFGNTVRLRAELTTHNDTPPQATRTSTNQDTLEK